MIQSGRTDCNLGKVVYGSSEMTLSKVCNGENRLKRSVSEDVRRTVAAANNEVERNRPQRKPKKYRLLSDIYDDPASELHAHRHIANPANVNRRFVPEFEDESDDNDDDDVTLVEYFRLDKKRNVTEVAEPRVDRTKKSKRRSKDSTAKEDGDPEMQAVMLLACHFRKAAGSYGTCVCSINRNPADFSLPNAENEFMRTC